MSESSLPSDRLTGPWYRIVAIPASARASTAGEDFAAVLPAVLSAAQRGGPFVIGWLSRGGGAPLELITNAGPLAHPQAQPRTGPHPPGRGAGAAIPAGRTPSPHGVSLLFPNGARGVPVSGGWLADAARLAWVACPARQAPPLAKEQGQDPPQDPHQPSLFESTLVTLMDRPFGWLVIAEPAELLDAEMAELRTRLTAIRRFEEERARLDVERAERRIAELDAFREAGLWHVRVLAGAETAAELHRMAPVLVGAADLSRHPYRLRSGLGGEQGKHRGSAVGVAERTSVGSGSFGAHSLADAMAAKAYGSADHAQVPFAATAGVLAALAGLPRREVPGLRVVDHGHFDVTSETEGGGARRHDQGHSPGSIDLGVIMDAQDRPVGTFRVPHATLNRHVFVTGATGAGKSQTVRHLLERLTEAGVPWLAIEPAKSEYAAMAGRVEGIGRVTVINPADPHAIPLSVHPLAPEPGFPVQAHIDMVRALFQAAFDAEEPFPQIMSQALQLVYEDNGWDVVTGSSVPGAIAPPAVPTLEQLRNTALQVIEDVGYGAELQSDVRGFVDVRLRSLRIGSAGRFFQGGHPADIGELLRGNMVLAIEDVANDEDKAFLMGTLIIRVVEHLRMRARQERAGGLRHVIVIEEAHRLLRDRGPQRASSHAVELFAGMLAEIRAYGEGVVVAEQIPTKLIADVVKNTALKVVHRLPAHDDRQLVGAAMNLDDDQSRQVVSLEPGVAAVFADGMDRPLRIRIPCGEQRERVLDGPDPPISGRRCAACGWECRRGPACTLFKLRQAELESVSPQQAWLRIWVETLVLAFLTCRGLPAVPEPARRRWAGLETDRRLGECLLATVIDHAVAARSTSLRDSYDPQRLTRSAAETALRILGGAVDLAGTRAGPSWVIPQLRWVHEVDRTLAAGRWDQAPALTYDLPGVADGPGVTAEERLNDLALHPLSMELAHNQWPAWHALSGDDEHRGFLDDMATVLVGVPAGARVREAALAMNAEWLVDVLSWPRRFMQGAGDAGGVRGGAATAAGDRADLNRGDAGRADGGYADASHASGGQLPSRLAKEGLLAARPPGSRRRGKLA